MFVLSTVIDLQQGLAAVSRSVLVSYSSRSRLFTCVFSRRLRCNLSADGHGRGRDRVLIEASEFRTFFRV